MVEVLNPFNAGALQTKVLPSFSDARKRKDQNPTLTDLRSLQVAAMDGNGAEHDRFEGPMPLLARRAGADKARPFALLIA